MNPIRQFVGRIQEFFVSNVAAPLYARVRSVTRRWRSTFKQPYNTWAR